MKYRAFHDRKLVINVKFSTNFFLQMQIPRNGDGNIFLVKKILCTDSHKSAFETKIRKHFMIYGKELMIILRILQGRVI